MRLRVIEGQLYVLAEGDESCERWDPCEPQWISDRISAELERLDWAEERISELEAKLADPSRLTDMDKAFERMTFASQRIKELERERDTARKFVDSAMQSSWRGCDFDGGEAQDLALKLGLIVEIPGGFDPDRHFNTTGDFDPGETIYQLAWGQEVADG